MSLLDAEPESPINCADCGEMIRGPISWAESDGAPLCADCYDARPYVSDCGCDHTPNGIELDMELCGDCHDHCGYVK